MLVCSSACLRHATGVLAGSRAGCTGASLAHVRFFPPGLRLQAGCSWLWPVTAVAGMSPRILFLLQSVSRTSSCSGGWPCHPGRQPPARRRWHVSRIIPSIVRTRVQWLFSRQYFSIGFCVFDQFPDFGSRRP